MQQMTPILSPHEVGRQLRYLADAALEYGAMKDQAKTWDKIARDLNAAANRVDRILKIKGNFYR